MGTTSAMGSLLHSTLRSGSVPGSADMEVLRTPGTDTVSPIGIHPSNTGESSWSQASMTTTVMGGPPTPVLSHHHESLDQQNALQTPWTGELDMQWAQSFVGGEFDVGLLGFASSNPVADDSFPSHTGQSASTFTTPLRSPVLTHVQRMWHTFSEPFPESQPGPSTAQGPDHIDEVYHGKLTRSLYPRISNGDLPSATFLVSTLSYHCCFRPSLHEMYLQRMCIQAYFANFHPIFPVVHAPSFRPQAHNGFLLLSICSIGSLFFGSHRAVSHGISMYERLNKIVLYSVQYTFITVLWTTLTS